MTFEQLQGDWAQLGESGIVAIRRLNRRYSAFGGPTTFPLLMNRILPVSIIDDVLESNSITVVTLDLTGGGSLHVIGFTVPPEQRFTMTHYIRGSTTGNSRVELVISGNRIPIEASGATANFNLTHRPFILDPGDTVGMLESGNVADDTASLTIIGRIESAF